MDPKPLRPLPTTYLSKDSLIAGEYYIGFCRNARIARWDGTQFWHWRQKFSSRFVESIKHPDDEPFFDVFQPVSMVDSFTVKEIPFGHETPSSL